MRRARFPLALLIVCCLLSACSSVRAAEATATPHMSVALPNPINGNFGLYFVGDSITFGRSATTYAHSYRALVTAYETQIQAPRRHVVLEYQPDDLSQPGVTWTNGWKLADALAAVQANPPLSYTGLIILAIGTNDAGFGGQFTPLATFTAQYQQLVQVVTTAAPTAEVICAGPWMSSTVTQPYEDVIHTLCPGGRFVDLSPLYDTAQYRGPSGKPLTWLGSYTSDNTHPNDAGMAAIAAGIEAYL